MKIIYILTSIFYGLKYLFLLIYTDLFCDVERVKKIQYKKLRKQIYFAWKNIPFYREYWTKNGFSPEQFLSLDDVKKIPFIDKNIVREHYEEMLPRNCNRKKLTLATTGGTTGMPMQFYIDNYKARAKELVFQLYREYRFWHCWRFIDKVAILRGRQIAEGKVQQNIFWEKADGNLYFSSFHLKNEHYEKYINKLREYKPKFIKAYPSSIVALCSMMKEHNDYGIEGLKGVICSSENIYDWQRNLVREVLGVEILSQYGHSEKAVWAFQYLDDKMCFHPMYSYVEFCDIDKNIDVNTGMAHVVCTSFGNDYFPFIRYKTYDYIEVAEPQSYFTHVASRVIGREQDFVYDRDSNRTIFTNSDEPFWGITGVDAYQYIQNKKGFLVLALQINDKFENKSIDIIKHRMSEFFVGFDFEIHFVEEIEKTKAGKFRYLIQNIK